MTRTLQHARVLLITLPLIALLLACSGASDASTRPTPTAAPTATPVAPTGTPDAAQVLLALVQKAAAPILRDAPWKAEQQDLGDGPEVAVTMPLNTLGDNAQIVRLNQIRMAGVVKAVFDAYPDVGRVNVIGTSPIEGNESPGISIAVTRAEYSAWNGTAESLGNWQVSQRLQ